MRIGFIGLGRMGGNMVRRLSRGGHHCHIYSVDPAERAALAQETGAIDAESLAALVAGMDAPRTTAAIPITATALAAPPRWRTRGCITSIAAHRAACSGWSAAIR